MNVGSPSTAHLRAIIIPEIAISSDFSLRFHHRPVNPTAPSHGPQLHLLLCSVVPGDERSGSLASSFQGETTTSIPR